MHNTSEVASGEIWPELESLGTAVWTYKLIAELRGKVLVRAVDLRIEVGTIYGLLGPKGAGKTTVLRILLGQLKPTSGSAFVLSDKVGVKENLSRIEYVPHGNPLYQDLTVDENLDLFSKMYSMDRCRFDRKSQEIISTLELDDCRSTPIRRLTDDMKRRASLACAVIHDPDLLFLDELSVGASPEFTDLMWKCLEQRKSRGRTTVITTDSIRVAARCDAISILMGGKSMGAFSPEEISTHSGLASLEQAIAGRMRRAVA
ncbi:MAG: ABC transporter ATP-binding protein [Thermoplasmata archaeon]